MKRLALVKPVLVVAMLGVGSAQAAPDAASVLEAKLPGALDHCQVGHASSEPGHRRLLKRIKKIPLLDFEMRLGEASGAALAVSVLKAAVSCHNGMATFTEAGVSDKK